MLACSIIACSIVGVALSGPLSDFVARRGARWRLYYCCLCAAISVHGGWPRRDASTSSAILGRAAWGYFVRGFVPGEPSLRQPSRGFLVCQPGHRRGCSVLGHTNSIRRSMALH